MCPRVRSRVSFAAMAAAVAAGIALAVTSCTGCIGVVEWGDSGDGIPVAFPQVQEATP